MSHPSAALRRLGGGIVLAIAALLPALPASAQSPARVAQSALFSLQIRGIPMGELAWNAVEERGSYGISGMMQTTGLAGLLRKMRYEAKVNGRLSAGGFAPARYEQSGGTGGKVSREVVEWRSGVPRISFADPPHVPRAGDADPARQRGTVDTLTTLYATLRDVPQGQECKGGVMMFDGRYRMELQLSAGRAGANGAVTCNGAYVRREGFSAAEMAERTHFPFTLHYQPDGKGMLRVTQVTMETLYGNARLVRR